MSARIRFGVLALMVSVLHPASAFAALDFDPEPPIDWKGLLECELVVVAKYQNHCHKDRLWLQVVEVLKGKNCKPGDVISVTLEHRYSIETGPAGWDYMLRKARPEAKPDNVPKLCYQRQMMNPGGLVPCLVVPDVRESAVYFLPRGEAPALKRVGQVQPMFLVEGWKQALAGKPVGLVYRLAQKTDPVVKREALEELYETRDAATLDQLFEWVLTPPAAEFMWEGEADEMLLAIGDKGGDVYNRAWKRFVSEAKGTNEYRFYRLAEILALVDPERAWGDFAEIFKTGSPALKKAAAAEVGNFGDERALNLAFDLLRDKVLAEQGVRSLREILDRYPSNRRYLKRSQTEWARLTELARPKLKAALTSADVPEAIKEKLRESFRNLLEDSPPLDLKHAEKVLLNWGEKCYQGEREGEGFELYQAMMRASDPRCVPLLVRVLREVPVVTQRGSGVEGCYEALWHYARLCPNAMRAELAKHGLDKALDKADETVHEWVRVRLFVLMETPRTVEQLRTLSRERGALAWFQKKQASPELIAALKKTIDENWSTWPSLVPEDLDLLLQLDLAEGMMRLDQALVRCDAKWPWVKRDLLALAVKYGDDERLEEFLHLADSLERSERALLRSENDKALARYLKLLDEAEQRSKSNPRDYPSRGNREMLNELFRAQPAVYWNRVLALLESPALPDQVQGEYALRGSLDWDFDFRAEDFARVRAERLAKLRPLLKKLGSLPEAEMRAVILREQGVTLEGAPSRQWLPALVQAAGSWEPGVPENALKLIEHITGEYGCSSFASEPAGLRKQALAVFLQDRQIAVRPQPALPDNKRDRVASREELDKLWADLAADETYTGYLAVAALTKAPDQSVPFLQERLGRLPPVDEKQVARLLADLDAETFAVREKASQELEKLGEPAVPFLRKALQGDPSAEVRRRVERLLKKLDEWTPERVRFLRAVEALELIGTPEARQVLDDLAKESPETRRGQYAKAALRRLQRQVATKP